RNLAQRKHTPPSRPMLRIGFAEPAGFSEGASCPRGKRRTSMCGAPWILSAAPAATEGPPKVKVYGKGKGKGIDHRATVGAAEAASSALALVGAASAASFLPRGAKCLSTRRTPAKTKPAPHGAGFVPSATLQLQ